MKRPDIISLLKPYHNTKTMSLEAELLVCVLAQVDSSSIFLGKIIIIVAASNVSYERKAEGRRGKSLGKLP